VIEICDLQFSYWREGVTNSPEFGIRIPQLSIAAGERLAVVGSSGSGKSTLLNLIAGVLQPDEGSIQINDVPMHSLDEKTRRAYRLRNIGMVFQNFELLEHLTVEDNILLPIYLGGLAQLQHSKANLSVRVHELATDMGIEDILSRPINRLSQGERQRAAICRALLLEPALILADEPTGNLDLVNSENVLELLLKYVEQRQATLIMVTHDQSMMEAFPRIIDMSDMWLSTVPPGVPK
jgi:putative ABC transport system ATP-binding protein